MNINQKNFRILLFAVAVFTTATFLLFADKKAKYDEYDRLMW
jgi:hypothetical protein